MAVKRNISLIQGKTYTDVIRWEVPPIVYKLITEIEQSAPVRIKSEGHGLLNGWRCAITNVVGMTEINATSDPNKLTTRDYHQATVIDPDVIEINSINAAGFTEYVSGGVLQYNTPMDLTGYTARMSVKLVSGEYNLLRCSADGTSGLNKPTVPGNDGTVIWSSTSLPATKEWLPGTIYSVDDVVDTKALMFLTTENGRIVIDGVLHTIKRVIGAGDIANAVWDAGYFDLEMVSSDTPPVVTLLDYGTITIGSEQTK